MRSLKWVAGVIKRAAGKIYCCCVACPTSETLELVFSGVGIAPDCLEVPGDGYYHGVSHLLDGPFTATKDIFGAWVFTIPGGYTSERHLVSDCSDEGDPVTVDLSIGVLCAVSIEGVRGFSVTVQPGGAVGAFFNLFEGSGELDEAISNTLPNGGTVTISLP